MDENNILEDFNRIPAFFRDYLIKFVEILEKKYEKNLLSVILYGSIARGTWNLESDIDIFLLFSNKIKEREKLDKDVLKTIIEFEKTIHIINDNGIQIYFPIQELSLKLKDLVNFRTLFYDISMDGIVIYDKDLIGTKFLEKIRIRIKDKGLERIFVGYNDFYWKRKENVKFGEIIEL